ncbi:MAG: hypothetical protein ACWGOV_00225 [Acidiferrobacterales bacterium]
MCRFAPGRVAILFASLVVPVPVLAGTAIEAIDQCIHTISHSQKFHSERKKIELDFYCPDLPGKINKSPLQKNLSYKFDAISSIAELRDLRQFLVISQRAPGRTYRFDYQEVGKIVEKVYQEKPKPQQGLWSRVWNWLKQYLPTLNKEQSEKLDKFFNSLSLSERNGKIIFYLSSALILIIATWIVYREWRYYRRAGGTRKLQQAGVSVPGWPAESRAVALNQIPTLPLQYRGPALLHWAIDFCIGRGELPSNQSLTSREMQRILVREKSAHSQFFTDLVGQSEKVVYGNADPNEAELDRLLANAEELSTSVDGGAR